MSTVAEIEAALPFLDARELMQIEAAVRRLQRARVGGVIHDDAYGVWTEEDQASATAEAWSILDAPPSAVTKLT